MANFSQECSAHSLVYEMMRSSRSFKASILRQWRLQKPGAPCVRIIKCRLLSVYVRAGKQSSPLKDIVRYGHFWFHECSNRLQLVSQGAASFMDKPAFKLQDTDHHEVCKFENKLGQGFKEVVKRLKALRMKLIFGSSEERSGTVEV
jgi:hypothetical protein